MNRGETIVVPGHQGTLLTAAQPSLHEAPAWAKEPVSTAALYGGAGLATATPSVVLECLSAAFHGCKAPSHEARHGPMMVAAVAAFANSSANDFCHALNGIPTMGAATEAAATAAAAAAEAKAEAKAAAAAAAAVHAPAPARRTVRFPGHG